MENFRELTDTLPLGDDCDDVIAPSLSRADTIAPHLPCVRRYARGLSGSFGVGDRYVAKTLQKLIEEPTTEFTHINPKVALFQTFMQVWDEPDIELVGDLPKSECDQAIVSMTMEPRQAFLLTAVEGFSSSQTGEILGKSEIAVSGLLERASQQLSWKLAQDCNDVLEPI